MPKSVPLNQIYGEPREEGGPLLVDLADLAEIYRYIGRSPGIPPLTKAYLQGRIQGAVPALEVHIFDQCDSCGHKKERAGGRSAEEANQ